MPTSTIIAPESSIPTASVKIIRFYYICIACVLTGAATFITGIIGTAVTYSNFAASAGTGIWTSMFVIAAGGFGIAIKSNHRNGILLKFFLAAAVLAVIFSGLMIILFIVALSTYAHPASVPYSAAAIAFALFNILLTSRLCKIYSETLESLAIVHETQRIQTVSTQQSMLQLLQQSNPHTTIVPPSYCNEPPPSYATSMTMQHAEYKETTPSHPNTNYTFIVAIPGGPMTSQIVYFVAGLLIAVIDTVIIAETAMPTTKIGSPLSVPKSHPSVKIEKTDINVNQSTKMSLKNLLVSTTSRVILAPKH